MFGYATDETPECMPVTILWAHRLNEKLRELRTNGQLLWARPDSKSQVGLDCNRSLPLFPIYFSRPCPSLHFNRSLPPFCLK